MVTLSTLFPNKTKRIWEYIPLRDWFTPINQIMTILRNLATWEHSSTNKLIHIYSYMYLWRFPEIDEIGVPRKIFYSNGISPEKPPSYGGILISETPHHSDLDP